MSRFVILLALLASVVAGPAMAFGHTGLPITTMPVIGDLIHLFGWYPQALSAVVAGDHYAMAIIVERCLGHSFVVELCYGSFERGMLTVILLPLTTVLTVWCVYLLIIRALRQQRFMPA